jgi:formylglycine-generating enzyme required for sulfatase activity
MSGNVWEWYGDYGSGSQTDPSGPVSGSFRVLRGGGWFSDAQDLRSANWGSHGPSDRYSSDGFRLVRAVLP